jgi:hypothetical protein
MAFSKYIFETYFWKIFLKINYANSFFIIGIFFYFLVKFVEKRNKNIQLFEKINSKKLRIQE